MSPRTGRPPKSENEKKTIRLEIRLTEDENKLLMELAKKLNMSKTEIVLKGISLVAAQNK